MTIDLIQQFYTANFERPLVSMAFIHVDGNSYDYYYRPNRAAFKQIKPRIQSSGWIGQIGAGLLGGLVRTPKVSQILPGVENVALSLPAENIFDTAIVGNRIKTIHLDRGVVYTFPSSKSSDLLSEVRVRQNLPDEINIPAVVSVDRDYPYFVEEFITGETLTNPVRQRDQLFMALEELRPLYEQRFQEWIDTSEFLDEIREELEGIDSIESTVIDRAYTLLDQLEVPESLAVSQVHGDLHPENIILSGNNIYILDWEHSKTTVAFYDFFKSFEVLYSIEGNPKVFRQMIAGHGSGGTIAARYAQEFGPLVFDNTKFPSGLPIVFLLYRLTDLDSGTSPQEHPVYHVLSTLISP